MLNYYTTEAVLYLYVYAARTHGVYHRGALTDSRRKTGILLNLFSQ